MSVKMIPKYKEKPKRCSAYNKKTHNDYVIELKHKNPNLIALQEYVDATTPIYHKCLRHNYDWRIAPTNALKGQGCKLCKAEKIRNRDVWTNDDYLIRLNSVNPLIIPLENYVNARFPIWHWFLSCGHIVKSSPESLMRDGKCLRCVEYQRGLSRRLSQDDFIKRMMIVNPYVEVLSNYKTALKRVVCRCKICGYIWDVVAASILGGTGCPICKLSHGEKEIVRCLKKYKITYNPQYTVKDLIGLNGGLLSYDFYLPSYNLLIEFQGAQHEYSVEYFGGEKQFEQQIEHDRRKREYAKQHGIKLLEIWYYDYDRIEEILKNNLNLETVETDIGA